MGWKHHPLPLIHLILSAYHCSLPLTLSLSLFLSYSHTLTLLHLPLILPLSTHCYHPSHHTVPSWYCGVKSSALWGCSINYQCGYATWYNIIHRLPHFYKYRSDAAAAIDLMRAIKVLRLTKQYTNDTTTNKIGPIIRHICHAPIVIRGGIEFICRTTSVRDYFCVAVDVTRRWKCNI